MIEGLTRTAYDAVLRNDFSLFAARCFHHLNPQTDLAMNWHIEVIAAMLTAVLQGKIRRLIINLPPRHLKSLLASIAFPAWCLGHDPSVQMLCISYAQDLADKLSRDCRQIVGDSRTTAGSRIKLSPSSRDGHGCGRPLRDRYVHAATEGSKLACSGGESG